MSLEQGRKGVRRGQGRNKIDENRKYKKKRIRKKRHGKKKEGKNEKRETMRTA